MPFPPVPEVQIAERAQNVHERLAEAVQNEEEEDDSKAAVPPPANAAGIGPMAHIVDPPAAKWSLQAWETFKSVPSDQLGPGTRHAAEDAVKLHRRVIKGLPPHVRQSIYERRQDSRLNEIFSADAHCKIETCQLRNDTLELGFVDCVVSTRASRRGVARFASILD